MKILVTGGAGFIGSHIVEAYKNAGHEVAIIDAFSTGKRENVHPDAELFELDITNSAEVERAFVAFQPDIVNHHAAQTSVVYSVRESFADAHANVLGTVNVLEAVRNSNSVKKLIYASSGGAMYGDGIQPPILEDMHAKPVSPYGLSKYVAEQYVWLYARLYGIKATVLRYSNVYGPRQDPHGEAGVCAIFCNKILQNEQALIFGDGSQVRDYVYVEDVARANVLALEKGGGESCHIATGIPTSTLRIFETIKAATHSEMNPVHEAARPGDVQEVYLSVDKAKEVLGWEPKFSVEEGIEKMVAWYRNQG